MWGLGNALNNKRKIRGLEHCEFTCDVRVGSCFVNGVYVRKFLQCLQITDNLAVPVNPRPAAILKLFISVVVGVILIECFDLGGGGMQGQVDVCERE